MKLFIFMLFTLVLGAFATQVPQKAVIITYPEDTPRDVLDKAMDAIEAAGGIITHEYKLIKGFAAKAPAKILESVQAWGSEYNAVVEQDQMVHVS